MNRRRVLQSIAALGIGTPVFHRALAASISKAQQDGEAISAEMIQQAEWIAGLELSEEDRKATAEAITRQQREIASVREFEIDSGVSPAIVFRPLKSHSQSDIKHKRIPEVIDDVAPDPKSDEELAFLPVTQLGKLLRSGKISSTELTKLYLSRLKKYNPLLNCVVTLTEELALQQAERADQELKAGRDRGPLHGIPWGAKDLIAYPGYPTTWGAPQFRDQVLNRKATVAQRLEDAGAVLIAKLTLGALAMGDEWFGGRTNNPWNPAQGSSGSSAGSASATAAGLVGFAIGSETLGSIVSPCRRCGASGLRPTFGRVSRAGCMPLSWSMDKIGPIARSLEDCAIVFAAIHGSDGQDPSVVDQPFDWPNAKPLQAMKVGYTESRRDDEERPELERLRELGVQLVKIELPQDIPSRGLTNVLDAEAATVFDQLTRTNNTEGLNAWGNIFRKAEFMTAVEYLRAMRVRRKLMEAMEEAISGVDLYVNGNDLVIANLTGHPTTVFPTGFRDQEGVATPTSITFTGQLYGESDLLRLSVAYQNGLDAHRQRPPLDEFLKAQAADQANEKENANGNNDQ